MKKKIIFIIIALFFIPAIVQADMGAPAITTYEARVNNKDGISVYTVGDYDKVKKVGQLEYDKIIKISYEVTYSGVAYGEIEDEDSDEQKLVRLSDITPVEDELSFERWKALKEQEYENFDEVYKNKRKLYVFRDGTYLYKGPSVAYGKVSEKSIPVGTELDFQYFDDAWTYVTYNGKNGWIYTYSYSDYGIYDFSSNVVEIVPTYQIVSYKDLELYDEKLEKKTGTTIPALTKIEAKGQYLEDPYRGYCYVTYENKKGWVKCDTEIASTVDNKKHSIYTVKDMTIYESYSEKSKKIGTIKKNSDVEIIYSFKVGMIDRIIYLEYDGKKGYVIESLIDDNENDIFAESRNEKYIFAELECFEFTDLINGSKNGKELKPEGEIPVKYIIDVGENTWVYIEDYGWTKVESPADMALVYDEEVAMVEPKPAKKKEEVKNNTLPSQFIYYAIGAFVLCVTTIVCIVLFNKKKKK